MYYFFVKKFCPQDYLHKFALITHKYSLDL